MKKLTTLITGIALLVGLAGMVPVVAAHAASNSQSVCEGSGGTWKANKDAPSGGECTSADNRTVLGTIQQLTDVLIFIVGAIAVLMIIIGGLRYITSSGDQAGLKSAKDTILYSVIGIIVAFMAYAIVHFIFGAFNIK